MKKYFTLSMLLCALNITLSQTQTPVGGGIYADVTWTLANSPYIMTGPVVVFPGKTLTIEPGVEVRVKNNIDPVTGLTPYLEVRGSLVAVGNISNPIVFTGDTLPTEVTWMGITVKATQGGQVNMDFFELNNSFYGIYADNQNAPTWNLNHCKFNYNNYAIQPFGPINFNDCSAIGIELAKELPIYTSEIRLVSRNPKKVNATDELFPADLTNRDQVFKAIEGSEVVYLMVGFEYVTKIWQQMWLPLVNNVIDACLQYNAKLVFFDNVYAIGGNNVNHITEDSPISPTSKKGAVRADVDRLILHSIEKRNLHAIIARSADFFSGVKDKSILMNTVYDNLAKGKKAQWFCNAKVIHSVSYTPDLAKGTALLGNTANAFNQIWNLPTDPQKITGEEWINLFATEMKASNKYQVLPGWGLKAIGLFLPYLNEMYEMRYQYDRDYYFDSSKFNSTFNFNPTKNAEAVKKTVEQLALLNASK